MRTSLWLIAFSIMTLAYKIESQKPEETVVEFLAFLFFIFAFMDVVDFLRKK